jgi:[ribosomal protein S5]-alanine N-acetyltransferase
MIDPTTLITDDKLTIATARLRLRPMRRDDAEGLFLVFCDAQAMRFWSSPPHGSPLLTAEVIERAQVAFMAGDGIEWAITLAGDDTAVGKIGHWRWQRAHSRSEVGFILRRDLWGQGIASEALAAVADWGFARLELNSIEAQLDSENVASQRTLERVGFRREGLLRQSYYDGHTYRDTLVYGLLRDERAKK